MLGTPKTRQQEFLLFTFLSVKLWRYMGGKKVRTRKEKRRREEDREGKKIKMTIK
jgi:hypothetical protein